MGPAEADVAPEKEHLPRLGARSGLLPVRRNLLGGSTPRLTGEVPELILGHFGGQSPGHDGDDLVVGVLLGRGYFRRIMPFILQKLACG